MLVGLTQILGRLVVDRFTLLGWLAVSHLTVLVVSLAWIGLRRYSLRETLFLSMPTGRALVATVLVACGAWAPGTLVISLETALLPGAAEYFRELGASLSEGISGLSFAAALAALTLLPVLGEEPSYRGVLLAGFRSSWRSGPAIAASALVFGLVHYEAGGYRVLPAAALGAVLAAAVLASGSLLPAVAAHMATNAFLVLSHHSGDVAGVLAQPTAVASGLIALVAGFVLLAGDEGVAARVSANCHGRAPNRDRGRRARREPR